MILNYQCCRAATTALNSNGISTLLASNVSIFLANGKLIFNNDPRTLPRNSPDKIILDISVFYINCRSTNITDSFKVTPAAFFVTKV